MENNKNALITLAAVQQSLSVPKGQYNSFGGFAYRSCEDILQAVKPILKEMSATIFLSDEVVEHSDGWVYVEATATFVDLATGEEVVTTASAREQLTKKGMDASQITGACSSYARKYALAGMFLLDNNKDADGMDNRDEGGEPKEYKPKNRKTFKCADCGKDIEGYGDKPAAVVAGHTKKKYGRQLCADCATKESAKE